MRILNITIAEFGKFKDISFDFGDRMNIIEGENESGKSTLLAFIRFILYGVSGRAAAGEVSERARALSWSGDVAGGSMTIETADGKFRLERAIRHMQSGGRDSYPEAVRIVDLETGEIIHKGEDPGEIFLGVPAGVFDSTCAVHQTEAAKLSGAELGASIENMLFTGDENMNTQRAVDRLEKNRKTLLYKNGKGGLIYDKSEEKRVLEERLARARTGSAAMVDCQNKLERLRAALAAERQQLADAEKQCNDFENAALLRRFDMLHEWERKEAELTAQMNEVRKKYAKGAFLPDGNYLASLQALRLQIKTAASDYAAAVEKRSGPEDNTTEGDRALAAAAARIRAAGGKEAVCTRLHALRASARRMLVTAWLFIALAVAALGVGAALWLLNILTPPLAYVPPAAGAVLLIVGLVCLPARRKKLRAYNDLLAESGLPETHPEQFCDLCFAKESALAEKADEQKTAEALLSERRRVLWLACDSCCEQLARVGVEMPGNMNDDPARRASRLMPVLERTIESCTEASNTGDWLRRQLEHVRENRATLNRELEGQNEAALRAELPEYPAAAGPEDDLTRLRARRDALRTSYTSHDAERAEIEKRLVSFEATADDPTKLALRIEELTTLLETSQTRFEALTLAAQVLNMAGARIRRGVTPRLRSAAGSLMASFSGNRYTDIGISSKLDITVDVDGTTRPIEALSSGTIDATYLAVRLSLLELLYGADRPPVMLDEALCQLDDTRARRFLSALTAFCNDGAQVLLFTCQTREAKMQEEIGYFTHILL